jgi:hypothetical protein
MEEIITTISAPTTQCLTQLNQNNLLTLGKDLIAPLVAVISLGFNIYLSLKVRPFERPVFKLCNSSFKPRLKEYTYYIENDGKHPAFNVCTSIFFLNQKFEKVHEEKYESSNVVHQGIGNRHNGKINVSYDINEENPVYVKIKITYQDMLKPKKNYTDEYWLKAVTKDGLSNADINEKASIEEAL